MKTKTSSLLGALAAATLIATPLHVAQADINSKGSDTMVILAQKWAEVYMKANPSIKIQVSGGGSGTGFAALQNQTVDLANASRPIKPAEKAECIKAFKNVPKEYQVALDGLSVYVHESNPVQELTLAQLEGIFTGKITNWQEVGGKNEPITLYSRENSSGTYEFFKEHVLNKKDFAANANTLQGTAQVIEAVAKERRGIGYGGAAYAAGIKALKVKQDANSPAVEPTEENIVSHKYPIWRFLYIYVNPDLDKGEVGAYLNWIRSNQGQAIVKDIGYFAIPNELRSK